jgi:hypothetical protein
MIHLPCLRGQRRVIPAARISVRGCSRCLHTRLWSMAARLLPLSGPSFAQVQPSVRIGSK